MLAGHRASASGLIDLSSRLNCFARARCSSTRLLTKLLGKDVKSVDIIVCVKRVAATDSRIKVAEDGASIDPAGAEFVINPYDEYAVEEALKTRDAQGEGTVTVVMLGDAAATEAKTCSTVLRDCLALGADKAVLLDTKGARHDAFSTATILAGWIGTVAHDFIFLGRQAVDSDDSQVPARVATLLDMPCVTDVVELSIADGHCTAVRDIEGGREKVRCATPAVISSNKGLNEPRYANLKGIMAAKKKPTETIDADQIAAATTVTSISLPPERPPGRILGEGPGAVSALIEALQNEAKVL